MKWCDFHVHSNFSDGVLSVPQIVDLYGKQGFAAIAITDHLCETKTILGKAAAYLEVTLTPESFPAYLETLRVEAERAWQQYNMVLIPGVEVTKNTFTNHRSAHMLILGVDALPNPDDSFENMCRRARENGSVTVAAHPVNTGVSEKQTYHLWSRRHELAPYVDAWEVASGRVLFKEVAESGLPMLANSDLHRPHQLESWKTIVECERNPQAILQAIRQQKISFKYFQAAQNLSPTNPAPNPTAVKPAMDAIAC